MQEAGTLKAVVDNPDSRLDGMVHCKIVPAVSSSILEKLPLTRSLLNAKSTYFSTALCKATT
jgi:hypothetical protein